MTSESKINCPNCDAEIVSDYCYECGYTTNGYNYLADKIARDNLYKEQNNKSIALGIIKNKYNVITESNNLVILHLCYVDSDRSKIREFFNKINKKYGTTLDYTIQRKVW